GRDLDAVKSELEEKSNEVNELNHKIKTLMSELSVGETLQKVQIRIQEVVDSKGFITDKEIEKLIREFNVSL
ncbi:unnamed protein product, partial [marine sediment metagenome]